MDLSLSIEIYIKNDYCILIVLKKRYIFKKKLVFWLIRWVKMILGVIGRVR